MAVWQRPARVGLAFFVVAFGIAVVFAIRDRSEPVRALIVDRTDPDAVIQSRGARIVQADASTENLRIVAGGSSTYADGAVRLIDGVTVMAAARADRDDFTLTGDEATVDADAGDVHITGNVRFRSGNGLEAAGAEASYSDTDGVVRIPGAATFTRRGMRAFGDAARYDRRHDLLYLESNARVELIDGDGTTPATEIRSGSATLAEADGYMRFEGGVTVVADRQTMEAEGAQATFVSDTSRLELLELRGHSQVMGGDREPGRLQEMTASDITLSYGPESLEAAQLAGGAEVRLFGRDGAPGARIVGRAMDVTLEPNGVGVSELRAQEGVVVVLPPGDDGVTQEIHAEAFTVTGDPGAGLTDARFDRAVEYRERRPGSDGAPPTARVTRAQRLEATLAEGLGRLEAARFIGGVKLEDGDVTGEADAARYTVADDAFVLETIGPAGQPPTVVDKRGSVRAESITITLDGPAIGAAGVVRSVLTTTEPNPTPGAGDAASDGGVRRPGLLASGPPILVTAGRLSYDSATSIATYAEGARLWQGDTEIQADTIVLDEAAGDISAAGAVRTRSTIVQNNDETGEPEESTTTGGAESVHYDGARRRTTYTTAAELAGPRGDLKAATIDVFFKEDARTLDRLEAMGAVTLELPGRWVSGTTLTYYDADGRYEMEGQPVRIVEEIDDACRETTGRSLTFFITADAVSVDGQSEVRTETASGSCEVLLNVAPPVPDAPAVSTPVPSAPGR